MAVALVLTWPVTDAGGRMALVALLAIPLLLPVWLLFSTDYRIEQGHLLVRSGPFRWRIPLRQIESVRPSTSLLSAPALSRNRLEIRYGGGKVILVSPQRPKEFLEALGHGHVGSTQR